MNNFTFYSPTKFVFGKDTENQAGMLVKEFGGSKVLLHFGGKSAEKSGLLGRVRESLKAAGLAFVELGGVHPNPLDDKVYEGIELCKREGTATPAPEGSFQRSLLLRFRGFSVRFPSLSGRIFFMPLVRSRSASIRAS